MRAFRSGMAILIACCTLVSARAMAQFSYYGQEDFRRCRAQTAAQGVPVGGIGGPGMGAVNTAGFGASQALAATAGASPGGGGLLGYGLSCDDEIRVTTHLFEYANNFQHKYRYFIPYDQQGVHIAQVNSGFDGSPAPNFCRLYQVDFSTSERQPRTIRTNMCYVGNSRWMIPNASPGVSVIVRSDNRPNGMPSMPAAPGLQNPLPAPRPVGPYHFSPDVARQYDPRQEIRPMPMPMPPAYGPANGPATPGVYTRSFQ